MGHHNDEEYIGEEERVSVYDQMGGERVVSAVASDLHERMVRDDLIGRWFIITDGEEIRFHLHAYLVVALGGPEAYAGRSMRLAHQGLAISSAAWERVLLLLAESLRTVGVDEVWAAKVIAIIGTFRAVIVETP